MRHFLLPQQLVTKLAQYLPFNGEYCHPKPKHYPQPPSSILQFLWCRGSKQKKDLTPLHSVFWCFLQHYKILLLLQFTLSSLPNGAFLVVSINLTYLYLPKYLLFSLPPSVMTLSESPISEMHQVLLKCLRVCVHSPFEFHCP